MVKNVKQKSIQGTVYFEPEVLEYLNECMIVSNRKISQEVNFQIKQLKKIRDANDLKAIEMADTHFKGIQDNQLQK